MSFKNKNIFAIIVGISLSSNIVYADTIKGNGGNPKIPYTYGNGDAPSLKVSSNACTLGILTNDNVDVLDGGNGNANISINCNDAIASPDSVANNVFFAATETIEMIESWAVTDTQNTPYNYSQKHTATINVNTSPVIAGVVGSYGSYYTLGNNDFYAYSNIEIVAHEIGHNLHNQSNHTFAANSALTEGFADVNAMATIAYISNKYSWWPEGTLSEKWTILDNVNKDSDEDKSISWLGDKTTSSPNQEVYDYYEKSSGDGSDRRNSTIFSVPYYKLANASGWSYQQAYKTFFYAMYKYSTKTSTFKSATCDVMESASDLGYDTEDVYNAFSQTNLFTSTYTDAMVECDLLAIPDVPTIKSATVINGNNIKLDWYNSTHATWYEIAIKYNNNPWTAQNYSTSTTSEITWNNLPEGDRKYKVVACNELGCSGPSSESGSVTILPSMYDITQMPYPDALAANSNGSTVIVEWEPLRDVSLYFINIKYNDNNWTDRTTWWANGNETSYTFTGLNAGKRQYRIEACDSGFSCTTVSESSAVVTTY